MSTRHIVFLTATLALFISACVERQSPLKERIAESVRAIRLIDSHEHLSPEKIRNARQETLFTSLHYALSDLWADGLDRGLAGSILEDSTVSLEKKWELIAPYWENSRNTVYCKSLVRAFSDLYGVPDLNASTYRELSQKISAANRPGEYREILQQKAGIDLAVCDVGLRGRELDPALFRAVIRFDDFLLFRDSFGEVQSNWGVEIKSLADWERALDKAFAQVKDWGFVGIKSGIAYDRSLSIEPVARPQAEALFNRLLADRSLVDSLDWRAKKPLQDYMFARIAENCARYDLPFQIHTGFFYDTWRDVSQADPTNLAPFIVRNPDTRFVLMHCGYPYGGELLAMAKNLPNVVLDMCWIYIISPRFAADFLDQAIETVPRDKLLGFGGDYVMPEGSYGHARLCREVVAEVLARKVEAGYWSEEEALAFARAILHDNPLRVFKVKL